MMEEAIEAIAKIIPADYEIIDNGDGTFTHSFNFRDPWIPPVTQ